MFDEIADVLEDIDTILAAVDVDSMVADEPASALASVTSHERAVSVLRMRLTARAEEMRQWQRQGYDSYEDWLAATQGTSRGKARQRARTANKMKDRPRTAAALGRGDISEDQAETIADAADKNPDAEEDLLDTAANPGKSHRDLQDQAARAKASAEDDKARARRLHRDRTARWGRDRDGHWSLHAKLEPHVGALAQQRLDAVLNRLFGDNRRAGNREPRDRYAADALAEILDGSPGTPAGSDRRGSTSTPDADRPGPSEPPGQAHRPGAEERPEPGPPSAPEAPAPAPVAKQAVLLIDLAAYRRGHVLSGETCEIRNVGPVPVEVARAWIGDAFIKVVIADGTDIRTVAHLGRHRGALLDTALQVRDPRCVVPTCDRTFQEWDHHIPHAERGETSLENLRGPCPDHHRQITHHGYRLEGGPGHWRWIDPDGRILGADDPADLPVEARAP